MLAESETVEGDNSDISTLSYEVCSICSAKLIFGKDTKHHISGGIVLCMRCWGPD